MAGCFRREMQANADSDCDISEDEDCVSIEGATAENEELQLNLRLERLKGKQCAFEFSPVSGAKRLNEDSPPDCASKRHNGVCSWFPINKEAKAVQVLNNSASSSSYHSAYSEACSSGIRGKAQPKFTFHSQRRELSHTIIHEDRLCVASKVHNLSDNFDAIISRTEKYPAAECLEDFVEEFEDQFDVGPAENCGNTESSIVELLDGLKDKTGLLGGRPKWCSQVRGRMLPIVEKGAPVTLGDRSADSEDSHTSVDTESSSDCDVNDQKLKLTGPYMKEQTITDRFEEALVAACMDAERTLGLVPNPVGIGLFGKLQRVMQSEKEREMDFLNGLHCSTISNGCVDVKILSRYFDAKLTVCSCFFINMELSRLPNVDEGIATEGEKRTVIFSPRVCRNVELEVGNLIRINPPWKEVAVDHAHNIILSTYFSQLN